MRETKIILAIATALIIFTAIALPAPRAAEPIVVGAGIVASTLPVLPLGPTAVPPELELSARAAVVKELDSGPVLYAKAPDAAVPIASLTKLMTAIVVRQHLSPDTVVTITPQDEATVSYRAGFAPGEQLTVADLLKAMLIASANDATLALARATSGTVTEFVRQMNAEAWALGMRHTAFQNPVGFDAAGQYSTATDLAILVEQFLRYPDLLGMVASKGAVVIPANGAHRYGLVTTNKLMKKYNFVVGLKTGYTAEARGNLIALINPATGGRPGRPYYSIVLGSANREGDTEKIMAWLDGNIFAAAASMNF